MARERLRYIEDGYTEDGFVRRRPGMWDEDLRFLYRPMTVIQQKKLMREVSKKREDDVDGQLKLQALAVCKQIIEWEYKRPDGRSVEVSVDSLLKMKPMLFAAVCSIVGGFEPSDVDHDQPHRVSENDEAAMQRIFGEETTAEELDAKNSEAG